MGHVIGAESTSKKGQLLKAFVEVTKVATITVISKKMTKMLEQVEQHSGSQTPQAAFWKEQAQQLQQILKLRDSEILKLKAEKGNSQVANEEEVLDGMSCGKSMGEIKEIFVSCNCCKATTSTKVVDHFFWPALSEESDLAESTSLALEGQGHTLSDSQTISLFQEVKSLPSVTLLSDENMTTPSEVFTDQPLFQGQPLPGDVRGKFDSIQLSDLEVVVTLGVGSFGRVELVRLTSNPSLTFAMKVLKKCNIIKHQQQKNVFNEKSVMLACDNSFILRLYRTFKDTKYLYFLVELCSGGEVWLSLRETGSFGNRASRFVVACVLEAFGYLHARGIIHRDLKPENLLFDAQGYVKLVDFGNSKYLPSRTKTYTYCGTPQYMAPEVFLKSGHDSAADCWALGVLVFDLITNTTPFVGATIANIYTAAMKGIEFVVFPPCVSGSARKLVKKLCRAEASERLGYQSGGIEDIRKHEWFNKFDWERLRARTMQVPIERKVNGPTDTSNFELCPIDMEPTPEDFSDWDAEF